MIVATGLTGKLWPAHPHRQDDELLSNWLVRTAHANRLKAQSFGSQVFGKRAFVMARDLDRCLSDAQLSLLSEQTGSPLEELRGGMLTSYEGSVFEQHSAFGNTQWILPSVSYIRRRRRFGMQFCPLCLFFDKQPYFRKRWRMAFVTICDVHGTMLHDRCPECGAPVVFFRNETSDVGHSRLYDLASCWECGYDLRRAPAICPSGPDGRTIMSGRSLATFHDLGWWFQGSETIQYGPLYFDVLHRLAYFLPTSYGRKFLAAIERETGWKVEIARDRKRCEFESKAVGHRHGILMAILWLLDEWPARFVRIAKSIGATQSQVNDGRPFPYWFDSVLRQELGNGFYRLTAEEARSAAAFLERTGQEVSANAIKRLVGGNNSAQSVRPYVKAGARPFTDTELDRIISHYDALHAALPHVSRPRLIWQRDKTILLLMHMTGWAYRKVRGLDVSAVSGGIPEPAMPACAFHLLSEYLRDTRGHMAGESSGGALFIKWKGKQLSGPSWECRHLKYLRFLKALPFTSSHSSQ